MTIKRPEDEYLDVTKQPVMQDMDLGTGNQQQAQQPDNQSNNQVISSSETTTTRYQNTGSASSANGPKYDRSAQEGAYNAYVDAMQTLQDKSQQMPGYQNQYAGAIDAAFQNIVNRGQFNYDLNNDAMYDQYRDKYLANAKISMMDAMGQAAGLTGGYGSSYGQQVGQQAYDAQLQKLNDIVPELYDRAYQRYQNEGDMMLQQYSMLKDREATDYNRHMDELQQWNTDRSFAQQDANNAYNRWMAERGYADQQDQVILAEQQRRLQELLTLGQQGYEPSEDELAAAGIDPAKWEYYKKTFAPTGGGSGNSSVFQQWLKQVRQDGNISNVEIDAKINELVKAGTITAAEGYNAMSGMYSNGKTDLDRAYINNMQKVNPDLWWEYNR